MVLSIGWVRSGQRVIPRAPLSRAWCAIAAWIALAGVAAGHEVQPAIADLTVEDGRVEIAIEMALEAPLADIDLEGLSDTNAAENAEAYDRLRADPPEELLSELTRAWPGLSERIELRAGEREVPLELIGADIPEIGNVDFARLSTLRLGAELPEDGTPLYFTWDPALGEIILRQQGVEDGYTAYLSGGETGGPIPREGGVVRSPGETFAVFTVSGFEHIIPKGLDHILFVLGLFFFALAWGPLLWQVSAFTLAHTITLGLATLGIIAIPAQWMWLVEAFIALSISWVAVENVFRPRLGWLRPAVVFGFGLLHGLGFASVLSDVGLPQGQFILALLSFNLGVEMGQLAVILAAFLLILAARGMANVARLGDEEAMVRDLPVIYRAVSMTGSILIAIVGLWWFFERIGVL